MTNKRTVEYNAKEKIAKLMEGVDLSEAESSYPLGVKVEEKNGKKILVPVELDEHNEILVQLGKKPIIDSTGSDCSYDPLRSRCDIERCSGVCSPILVSPNLIMCHCN